MAFGLDDIDIENIRKVFNDNKEVDEAIIFGSRAKGNFKPGSDIDIAIKGENLNLNTILDISTSLDELMLPYKFDIIIYKRITEPKLTEHIDRVGVVLFKR
jgi:predicted nucleotidyltransferase